VLAALAALAAAACGESPEERLERVTRELADVRAAHAQAEQRTAERERVFERDRQELEAARRAEREAELALAEAEKRVDLRGLDDLIFRLVQERLLDDEDLERAAIRARVERGVVTLEGSAPSAALRDRAIGIAQTTAGVSRVKDSIRVAAE
jgi:osmotically-inducible protein OsmY